MANGAGLKHSPLTDAGVFGCFQPAALAAGAYHRRGGEWRGVKTPALRIITPLGLKTDAGELPSSPEGVAAFSPLL
ncbi:MAG: hypothetical protein HS103_06880 [Anaerolineales bacterium]|nr:hypothetical protein [Anaerolineales bacterium]